MFVFRNQWTFSVCVRIKCFQGNLPFVFFFHKLYINHIYIYIIIYYTRGQDDVRKRQFFGVTSHGPKWEIKKQNQGIKNHSILK